MIQTAPADAIVRNIDPIPFERISSSEGIVIVFF